ncbi:UNVERIFIED_CONTAM: hypothetical protein Sindi_2280400, partial [Sesamum indicum]
ASHLTSPLPSPPQSQCPDIDDRVLALERYIRSIGPNWLDLLVSEPPTDPPTPAGNDDEHVVVGDNNLY